MMCEEMGDSRLGGLRERRKLPTRASWQSPGQKTMLVPSQLPNNFLLLRCNSDDTEQQT